VKAITSRQNPLVQRCRDLARARNAGTVLLDGPHVVAEALLAGVPVDAALVTARALAGPEGAELVRRLRDTSTEIFEVPDAVLDAASPVRSPSGVLAIARWDLVPVARIWDRAPALAIAVDRMQDPGNLGAVIRTADAAGAAGLIVTGASADPLGWKALRGSMGSVFRLPVAAVASLDSLCEDARARGLRVLATSPAGGLDLYETPLTGPSLVLMGGEGPGLAPDVIASADATLRIPMHSEVESLNVAVAAGIILFEAVRQRRLEAIR
jgi:RNA methyltransferase, TrmH family